MEYFKLFEFLPQLRTIATERSNWGAIGDERRLYTDRFGSRPMGIPAAKAPARPHRSHALAPGQAGIAPRQAPLYGDAVTRLVMAARGLSRKCLMLDLDNTLWGGVVGDDGLKGIRIGQGSPEGEAYAAFQFHLKQLPRRGVALAVGALASIALLYTASAAPTRFIYSNF